MAIIFGMKRLYILCGIAFSGKTTLAKELCEATGFARISLDEINAERGFFGGEGLSSVEWERTHEIAQERMRSHMAEGRNIVLDDTNCFRWLRQRYSEFAHCYGYVPKIVYVEIPISEIQRRIDENGALPRRHTIAAAVFQDHVRNFERPDSDEKPIVLADCFE